MAETDITKTPIRQRMARTAERMRSFNLLRFLKIVGVIVLLLAAAGFGLWHYAWYFATNSERHDQLAEANARQSLSFASYPQDAEGRARAASAIVSREENAFAPPEAPIANWAEYRRCGGSAQTVRAHGESMACSQPKLTDRLRILVGEGETFYRQMRAACNRHDFCYAQGGATYGQNRAACDKGFLADLLRECTLIYGDPADHAAVITAADETTTGGRAARRARAQELLSAHANCRRQATLAYTAVRVSGRDYFKNNYQPVCDYEPGPHGPRDTVVAGRFLDAADSPQAKDYALTVTLGRDAQSATLRLLEMNAGGQSEERGAWTIAPDTVPVVDRDRTCRVLTDSAGAAPSLRCPQTLKDTAVTAADWLRIAPIVVDADGVDGAEVVIPTLTRDFGLGFTHIRFTRSGTEIAPDIRAYLGVARFSDEPGPAGCETNLEFSDCATALEASGKGEALPILSGERGVQGLAHAFLVVDRRQAGCGATAFQGQDLVLNSRHALRDTSQAGNMGFRLRRFTYDKASDRWLMYRDRHQNDGHRVYRCGGTASPYEHYKRFQYGQFNAGFDVECTRGTTESCPTKCADPARGDSRLEMVGSVLREKCPTSTFQPGAGELNDIDVMLYDLSTNSAAPEIRDPRDGRLDWVNSAWSPFVWKEPAHPLVTSPEARRGPDRIMAVGTYVGGDGTQKMLEEIRTGLTYSEDPANAAERRLANFRRLQQKRNRWRDRRYPVLTVLRHDAFYHKTLIGHAVGGLGGGEVRMPDTNGHLPDRYAVSWDIEAYGNPASYYELPSVFLSLGASAREATAAAPVDTATTNAAPGRPQMAMAFFLNPYLSANLRTERQRGPGEEEDQTAQDEHREWQSGDFQLRENMFRVLIVPVPQPGDRLDDRARMIDCPLGAAASSGPARIGQGWQKHFLKNEPVLVGVFSSAAVGGGQDLAVAWRREDGTIQFTALRFDGREWRFGDQACVAPVPVAGDTARQPPELNLRKLP
jgi:hypothetical protein